MWISEVFIPFPKKHPGDNTKSIILVMDGHDSHETPELQRTILKILL